MLGKLRASVFASATLGLSFALTCSSASKSHDGPPPFADSTESAPSILREWTGLHSAVAERQCELIEDGTAWRDAWMRTDRASSELPPVDFAREHIVAVFHGTDRVHSFGGSTLQREGESLVLQYSLFTTSGVLSPITQPFGFFSVSRADTPIRVRRHHSHGPGPPELEELGTLFPSALDE
ncbi:MAG: hypothetical protein H6831_03885 [Planctomycetes bacterium]|nr:hypothetical protein [Planctomycetota bacterium]MCB9903527.1 hypothetical protein [Planctomycetota bacterium]